MLLLRPEDSSALLSMAVPLITRANFSHPGNPNEGTNLVWMASGQIMLGVLTRNSSRVATAYGRIAETCATDPLGEGMQHDASWHQHGAQLYRQKQCGLRS